MPTKLVLPLLVVLQDESGATVQDPIQAPPTEYGLGLTVESVETERHDYVYASGQLLREVITTTDAEGNVTTETLDFTYDASGSPYTLTYTNGTASPVTYYYVTNLQGDVIRLVSANGATVAEYWYGPYGEVLTATGTMAEVNPLRYRGYYYDAETELFYLQSRYYDPVICRFVNADGYASTGQGFLGWNMFAYCSDNPINCIDSTGRAWWGNNTVMISDATREHNPDLPSDASLRLKKKVVHLLLRSEYSFSIWHSASMEERQNILRRLAEACANILGIEVPKIHFLDMGDGIYGGQNSDGIRLNTRYMGMHKIMVSTILHEMYHEYQDAVIADTISHGEPLATVAVWKNGNYTYFKKTDHLSYLYNVLEASARWFSHFNQRYGWDPSVPLNYSK